VLITLFPVLSLPPHTDKLAMALAFVPALALSSLFVGSTIFTESISASKYPEAYGAYRKRVGMFLPVPWGWVVGEEERKRGDVILWGKSKNE
jgi:protein-S-isoprenylcysteine O-methyltransferase Ste14